MPTPLGEGGVPTRRAWAAAVAAARHAGRPIGAVVLTLPDNPTGTLAAPERAALCQVAAEHDLIIIADEIYRDLVHDPAAALPARPGRAAADGGHHRAEQEPGRRRLADRRGPAAGRRDRAGPARTAGRRGQRDLVRPVTPIQQAAALAFGEPLS